MSVHWKKKSKRNLLFSSRLRKINKVMIFISFLHIPVCKCCESHSYWVAFFSNAGSFGKSTSLQLGTHTPVIKFVWLQMGVGLKTAEEEKKHYSRKMFSYRNQCIQLTISLLVAIPNL